jgi:hypothetical protein
MLHLFSFIGNNCPVIGSVGNHFVEKYLYFNELYFGIIAVIPIAEKG